MADPYSVLGVSPSASKAEIKAVFRKKAMAHHPDMHTTAPEGVKRAHDAAFKALNEAYQTLMDDTQRSRHRQRGGAAGPGGFARGSYYGASAGAAGSSYYGAGGRGAEYDPFASSYGSGTGSRYWGYRQYKRRGGFGLDFGSLFRSFSGMARAQAAATLALGMVAAGSMLVLEPLADSLWHRNNQGKLFSSIEADWEEKKRQRQAAAAVAAAKAREAAAAAARQTAAAREATAAHAGAAVSMVAAAGEHAQLREPAAASSSGVMLHAPAAASAVQPTAQTSSPGIATGSSSSDGSAGSTAVQQSVHGSEAAGTLSLAAAPGAAAPGV